MVSRSSGGLQRRCSKSRLKHFDASSRLCQDEGWRRVNAPPAWTACAGLSQVSPYAVQAPFFNALEALCQFMMPTLFPSLRLLGT